MLTMSRAPTRMTLKKLSLGYLVGSQAIYVLYEVALNDGVQSGWALALGLLLALVSMPFGLLAGFIQWHAAQLLGFSHDESHAFWPRMLACQVPLLLNFCLLTWWTWRAARAP